MKCLSQRFLADLEFLIAKVNVIELLMIRKEIFLELYLPMLQLIIFTYHETFPTIVYVQNTKVSRTYSS